MRKIRNPIVVAETALLAVLWTTLRPLAWLVSRFGRTLGVIVIFVPMLLLGGLWIAYHLFFCRAAAIDRSEGLRSGRLYGKALARRRARARGRHPLKRAKPRRARVRNLETVSFEQGGPAVQGVLDTLVEQGWRHREVCRYLAGKGARWIESERREQPMLVTLPPRRRNAPPQTALRTLDIRYRYGSLWQFFRDMMVTGVPFMPVDIRVSFDPEGRLVSASAFQSRKF